MNPIDRHQPGPDPLRSPIELWAGVECSVVRLGDGYHDQLVRGGHADRPGDLDLIAGLGVRALRQPILWERIAPDGLDRAEWSWADDRLGRLRALGVRPIVGLVHHGGGPRSTSLVDPSFGDGLAEFAGAVAARFPWVEDYTPVNEPLTTARFSGLYGHWHPHGRDDRTFARALWNQCRAVALAMRAVRLVNPSARLIQTDDLGRTHATPSLAYQADFENERRWLAFDLLMGRVDRGHPLRDYLRWAGLTDGELGWSLDNPCPPDLLGLNHYLTSERFLDPRHGRYPPNARGGNGRKNYADVEAVRVLAGGTAGPGALIREAWARYGRPMAITEVHLGCTREEQLRWFLEVWESARVARLDGVDVRAVTAWAVFGTHDWDSLMTRRDGRYEPGAFDVRSPRPRPTALAKLLRALADGRRPDHPVLDSPGWWHRPERLLYPPIGAPSIKPARGEKTSARPLAVFGADGEPGATFARLCDVRGLCHRDFPGDEGDLDDLCPWAVVAAGGDGDGIDAGVLADDCARRGIGLLVFSAGRDSVEEDRRVLAALPSALVVRASGLMPDLVHAALDRTLCAY